jgi:hypothetical protein
VQFYLRHRSSHELPPGDASSRGKSSKHKSSS